MKTVEARTLRAILKKSDWESLKDVVEMTTFQSTEARKVYGTIERLHQTTECDLTLDDVSDDIYATYHLKLDLRDKLLEELRYLEHAGSPDPTALKQTVITLVQKGKAMDAANYIASHVDDLDFNPSIPAEMLSGAADLEGTMEADVVDYRTAVAPGMDDRRGIVSLGLHPDIDRAMGGGIANGEVVLYVAASNNGKTSHMCWSAAHAAKLGCNILHVSCEDHEVKVRQRYDSCLTGLDKDGLLANPELVMSKRATLPGNIYIKDWSSKSVRPADIKSLVMRMNNSGRKIHMVVVDYIGKMEPDKNMGNNQQFFGQIAMELRRAGSELQYKTLSGWQAKREGFSKEILGPEDFAKDITVYHEVDGVIGININPIQRKNKKAVHNVMKSRDGSWRPARIHNVDMDAMVFHNATTQKREDDDGVTDHTSDN